MGKKKNKKQTGTFETLPSVQADQTQQQTNVALPGGSNVKRGKNWVDENKK